jgi:hypothetical protein
MATIEPITLGRLQPVYAPFYEQPDLLDRAMTVQGKKASLNEYNVAKALDTVKLSYEFQLGIAGGRDLLGGIVLDFLVYTIPWPTPLWVHGEYWHQGPDREKDLRQQAIVDSIFRGEVGKPVEIWGSESETEAAALAAVRIKLL